MFASTPSLSVFKVFKDNRTAKKPDFKILFSFYLKKLQNKCLLGYGNMQSSGKMQTYAAASATSNSL